MYFYNFLFSPCYYQKRYRLNLVGNFCKLQAGRIPFANVENDNSSSADCAGFIQCEVVRTVIKSKCFFHIQFFFQNEE